MAVPMEQAMEQTKHSQNAFLEAHIICLVLEGIALSDGE
jgi:hypothetical protein